MVNNESYTFPLTLTEEQFKFRNDLTHCLAHILTQVALKGIDLMTFPLDNMPFEFDYVAMTALTDIFESDNDVIITVNPSLNTWDMLFSDDPTPKANKPTTTWETDYRGHHFTFHIY